MLKQATTLFAYFNSHAHVERDTADIASIKLNDISTHTLTWSVTGYQLIILIRIWISTHTLTWSVTLRTLVTSSMQAISTHTLTWSVTPQVNIVGLHVLISTHTLTWSVTIKNPNLIYPGQFQLTRSRGA